MRGSLIKKLPFLYIGTIYSQFVSFIRYGNSLHDWMNIKRLLLFGCLLLCFLKGKAQFDVEFTNYWALNGFYNPAYAGQTDKLNIYGTYSMQMLGLLMQQSLCILVRICLLSFWKRNMA